LHWAIESFGLSKQYKKPSKRSTDAFGIQAVNQVDLKVKRGEIFGLVGPNGAGKTTLIKMLCTLIVPTDGMARVFGYNLDKDISIKRSIGLVTTDERSFYWRLTGRQNLEFFASLHEISPDNIKPRINEVLNIVNLQPFADSRFQTYSSGMRQRLSIARALIHKPKLLFLDEPTKGLDLPSINSVHHLIQNELVNKQHITVFLTSHWLEEVEQLCNRVAIINNGQIVACGTMPELRESLGLGEKFTIMINNFDLKQFQAPSIHNGSIRVSPVGQGQYSIELRTETGSDDLDKVLSEIKHSKGQINHITHQKISLEDIFSHHIENENAGYQTNYTSTQSDSEIGDEDATIKLIAQPDDYSTRLQVQRLFHKQIHNIRIVWAFLKRDFQIEISYRFAFALQFMNVFFSIAIFYFLASFLGESTAPYLEPYGGDYFAFVLIGIAFAGYFGVGLSSFANNLREAQTTGTLEAMLTTPTGLSIIIISSSLWSYLMTTIRVALYLFIGAAFLDVNLGNGNYPLAVLVLILTILSFSSLGIIAASFIMVLKRGNPITWLFNSTSNLLGGIYYPISVLPNWLLVLSYLLPITYALRAMRLTLLQGETLSTIWLDILALLIFCFLLLPISLFSFSYAVRRSKIDGSLTQY
jgi:ABC-2 type transport system permease protein